MTKSTTNELGQSVYTIDIPSDATYIMLYIVNQPSSEAKVGQYKGGITPTQDVYKRQLLNSLRDVMTLVQAVCALLSAILQTVLQLTSTR